jgi:hypothetical protein
MSKVVTARAFKTDWFAKAAKKADISDADLCKAGKILVEICHGQEI